MKYLLGESTSEEKAEVEHWLHADSINQKYYHDFKLIWEESKQFTAISTIDEEDSWQRFRKRIHEPSVNSSPIKSLGVFFWMKVAAMIIIIGGTGVILFEFFNSKPKTLLVKTTNDIVSDTLPDGSIITLNKNSVVSYPGKFNGDTRNISLEGEAFFNVSPDKSKPFIIHVNDITVRVIGTSFNIKSIGGNTEVIVESGVVSVQRKNKSIDLHPSEKVLIKKADTALQKETETENLYNYYRTKEFECDNTPLWKLIDILNETYHSQIIIENKKLRNLPLTTTFKNESLDTILEIIRQTFDISVVKSGDTIILK